MELYTETICVNQFMTQNFFMINIIFMTSSFDVINDVIILSECYKYIIYLNYIASDDQIIKPKCL